MNPAVLKLETELTRFLFLLIISKSNVLTCVGLAAHADISVAGHLRSLVVGCLILLWNLGILLCQKGHSLGQVSIAHLQQQCVCLGVSWV